MKKHLYKFLFFICTFLFFTSPAFAQQLYDMADAENWNIRWDGETAGAGNQMGLSHAIYVEDMNDDGLMDMILVAPTVTANGRSFAGAIYIIYDAFTNLPAGTGNTIDMTDPANWNIRIEGTGAVELLGATPSGIGDIDGDQKLDMLINARVADNSGRTDSGSVWVLLGSLLDDYEGTGNTIDLANPANFNARFDGGTAGDWLGSGRSFLYDINGDERDDLFFSAQNTDYNALTDSGSVYIVDSSIITDLAGTGNILSTGTAANYTLRIDGDVSDIWSFPTGDIFLGDIDTDEDMDLIIPVFDAGKNGRSGSGSLWVIKNELLDLSGTGNTLFLGNAADWNIRFDGRETNERFALSAVVADYDNDGMNELVVGAFSTDATRTDAGSVYIVDDPLLTGFEGTGNTVDMLTSTNWTARIDGAEAGQNLGINLMEVVDFNNNGQKDIVTIAFESGATNGKTGAGSLYILYDHIFQSLEGTGNIVDLAGETEYLRYQGAETNHRFGNFWAVTGSIMPHVEIKDINGDGTVEVLTGSGGSDYNARTDSGSLYLIYNFPHEFTTAGNAEIAVDNYTLTGTVDASESSVTDVTGVEYQLDANDVDGTWTACTADDGAYDSKTEDFSCALAGLTEGAHTIYLRAQDTNTVYTAPVSYAEFTLTYTTPAPDPAPTTSSGGSSRSVRDRFLNRNNTEDEGENEGEEDEGDEETNNENEGENGNSGENGGSNPPTFRDVSADDWFSSFVEKLRAAGIITGYGDQEETFGPANNVTRAELVKMIVEALNNSETEEGTDFEDTQDHWAREFIRQARAQGWVEGYTPTLFHPDDPVTRAEAAKMLVLAFGLLLNENAADLPAFPDVSSADWFFEYVTILASHSIIGGYPDGTFLPNQFITRAEIAKLVSLVLE